jgi:hypothetical protein
VQALGFVYGVTRGDGFSQRILRTDGAIGSTVGAVVGTGLYWFLLVHKCIQFAEKLEHMNTTVFNTTVLGVTQSIQTGRIAIIVGAGILIIGSLWLVKLNPDLKRKR